MSKSDTHGGKDRSAGKPAKSGSAVALRDKAGEATTGIVAAIGDNPLAALLGGIALGAAAGALIPRGDREKALLAPLGDRLAEAAGAALAAGREAGGQALSDSGLTIDGLRDQVGALFGHATGAATAAAGAAFAAARDKATG